MLRRLTAPCSATLAIWLALVVAASAHASLSSATEFKAVLSWSEDGIEKNVAALGTQRSLYIQLSGADRPTGFRYDLHYSAPDHAADCFRLRAAPIPTPLAAAFRPTDADSGAAGRTVFGRTVSWPDGDAAQVRIDMGTSSSCEAFPMRFLLGHVEVDLADGTTRKFWSGEEVTIMGGDGVSFQPIIRNAIALPRSETFEVWTAVEHADSAATTFGLWSSTTPIQAPLSVEWFGPLHVLLSFAQQPADETFLLASRDGRTTRFKVPITRGADNTNRTWFVDPADSEAMPTLGAALAAAADGDTILVRPGTYHEQLRIAKRVWIESTDGPEVTTLDGGYQGTHTVRWEAGAFAPAALVGFTITGGGGSPPSSRSSEFSLAIEEALSDLDEDNTGGGVHIGEGCSVLVLGNVIVGNNAELSGGFLRYGAGIGSRGSSLIAENSLLAGEWVLFGGGLFCGRTSEDLVLQNFFEGNHAIVAGGAIYLAGEDSGSRFQDPPANQRAPVVIADNSIVGNDCVDAGGGVAIGAHASALIAGNTFRNNFVSTAGCPASTGGAGGGIHADAGAAVQIEHNTIEGCSACWGGGVFAASPLHMEANEFRMNRASWAGGAVFAEEVDVDGLVSGNRFVSNLVEVASTDYAPSTLGGGALMLAGYRGRVENNLFWHNQVVSTDNPSVRGGGGGAICFVDPPPRTPSAAYAVSRNSFVANVADDGSAILFSPEIPGTPGPHEIESNVFAYSIGGDAISGSVDEVRCNVFWKNDGAVHELGACSNETDPLFCDLTSNPEEVDEESPLLTGFEDATCNCGPIGRAVAGCQLTNDGDGGNDPLPSLGMSPIPSRGPTSVVLVLGSAAHATIELFDASGKLIRTIADDAYNAGVHRVDWDGRTSIGRDAPSGVYFVRSRIGSTQLATRLVVLR